MNLNRHGLWSSAAVVAVCMFASAEVRAQAGQATLTGKVTDASTKAPVPDVVVTITSPAVQGEQTVVTDAEGYFRAPNLPPGNYQVRYDKESYKPYARPGIELRAETTLRVDADILPEGLKEEIVVVASPPTVDVGSSNTGLSISNEFAKRIPLVNPGSATSGAVRSYEAVAQATPQASGDAFGTSINGTTSMENNFQVDGLSRNNAGFGVNGAKLSIEFVKEVNVLTGGYMPEYGAAGGGILSAITKSGSNDVHGSGWFYLTPGAFEGDRTQVSAFGQTVRTTRKLGNIFDLGADVGGPIIKDKLWFYGGFIYARTAYDLTKVDQNANSGPLQDTQRGYTSSREDIQVIGKLTYGVDKHNKLTFTGYALPTQSGGSDRVQIDPLLGVPGVGNIAGSPNALFNEVKTNTFSLQGDWDWETPSKKVLVRTTIGWMHQTETTNANDGSSIGDRTGLATIPGVVWRRNTPGPHSIADFEPINAGECDPAGTANATLCPANNYSTGGPGFLSLRTFDRWQGRSVLTALGEAAGHHVIKAGIEGDFSQYVSDRGYSGGTVLRESPSGGSFSDYRNYSYLTGPDNRVLLNDLHWVTHSLTAGAFVQDSWAILDKVTVNAGLRYDWQVLFGGDGAVAITMPNQISPRIGVVYDPTQKGRAKIYGNFARYYQSIPLNIADRAGSSEPQTQASRSAKTCNPLNSAQLTGAACEDPANFSNIGSSTTPDKKYSVIGAGKTAIDPDLKPQYSDEFVFGGEYDLLKYGRVGTSYTHREVGRIIEDVSRDEAQSYFITNPGTGATSDFPKPTRVYNAWTLFFQKSFGGGWEGLASYTLSFLRGNYPGLYNPETNQLDPGSNSLFDLKSLVVNRDGYLPGDTRHNFKAFGSKSFELSERNTLSFGGAVRASSGAPTQYLGSHPLYGAGEIYILPSGSGNRLPWTENFDVNVHFDTKITAEKTLGVSLDVFNLFNLQEVTSRDENYTFSDVNPIVNGQRRDLGHLTTASGALLTKSQVNPNFGNATSYQTPRQIKLGIRGTF